MKTLVKILGFSVVAVTLFVLFIQASAGSFKAPDLCESNNTSFVNAEKLTYKIYYNWKFVWLPAGEVTMLVNDLGSDYEVIVKGSTYEAYDNFFRVRDYFYSRFDKKTLRPNSFVRQVEEGDYRLFDSISFNQAGLMATTYHGKTRESSVVQMHKMPGCMHDLVSILYALRNTDVNPYKKGDIIPAQVFFDKEIVPVKVKYNGKEKSKPIKDLGKFNSLMINPDLIAGNVFDNGAKMNIWVSDDNNKIPLLIESPLKIGTGKAVLKSYSNLRHPLTSKVK